MATERTDGNGEGGMEMTERYTGPSAKRIARHVCAPGQLRPGLVLDDDGRSVYGGRSDGLAFRQRPDGEGIDVHCHTGGCSGRRGDNAPGDCHRAAHLDGLRACERRTAVKAPEKQLVVEAQAGSRGRDRSP